jgi:hypothetical protein
MKTREELLHRIPIDEIRPWTAFRRRFAIAAYGGTLLLFSGFLVASFSDKFTSLSQYIDLYGRVAMSGGLFLFFIGIPCVILMPRCPKCGKRLNVKQWTTDKEGVVLPCEPCRIGWGTGMMPYCGSD